MDDDNKKIESIFKNISVIFKIDLFNSAIEYKNNDKLEDALKIFNLLYRINVFLYL